MNALIAHRRHKKFGVYQDGKSLNIEQIKTFLIMRISKVLLTHLLAKTILKK